MVSFFPHHEKEDGLLSFFCNGQNLLFHAVLAKIENLFSTKKKIGQPTSDAAESLIEFGFVLLMLPYLENYQPFLKFGQLDYCHTRL